MTEEVKGEEAEKKLKKELESIDTPLAEAETQETILD